MGDTTMFTTLMISATALAIAAITVQSQADREEPAGGNRTCSGGALRISDSPGGPDQHAC